MLTSQWHLDCLGCARLAIRANCHQPLTTAGLVVHCRSTDLLLLEVDAEVQEFVACLKDWPLKWWVLTAGCELVN